MIQKMMVSTAIAVALTFAAQAKEAAKSTSPVAVSTASYQQMPVRDKKGKIKRDKHGKPILKWVRATRVVPGTIVRYIDTVTNHTDKALSQVAIKNPINPHLSYVAKTARCETGCEVYYSVDDGRTFGKPDTLYIKDKQGKKHRAQPKHYNAVKWVIAEVPAQGSVKVEFKAKLK
jgi:hypothetical protein